MVLTTFLAVYPESQRAKQAGRCHDGADEHGLRQIAHFDPVVSRLGNYAAQDRVGFIDGRRMAVDSRLPPRGVGFRRDDHSTASQIGLDYEPIGVERHNSYTVFRFTGLELGCSAQQKRLTLAIETGARQSGEHSFIIGNLEGLMDCPSPIVPARVLIDFEPASALKKFHLTVASGLRADVVAEREQVAKNGGCMVDDYISGHPAESFEDVDAKPVAEVERHC